MSSNWREPTIIDGPNSPSGSWGAFPFSESKIILGLPLLPLTPLLPLFFSALPPPSLPPLIPPPPQTPLPPFPAFHGLGMFFSSCPLRHNPPPPLLRLVSHPISPPNWFPANLQPVSSTFSRILHISIRPGPFQRCRYSVSVLALLLFLLRV